MRSHGKAVAAVMGNAQPVMHFGIGRDLAQLAEAFGDDRVRLDDGIAAGIEKLAKLVQAAAPFAAGDAEIDGGAQSREVIVVVAAERLLDPGDAEGLQLPAGRKRAMVIPYMALLHMRRSGPLRLISIRHNLHAVTDGVAHRPYLGDVVCDRRAVEAELDGPIALLEQAQRILRALPGRTDFDRAGIAQNPVGRAPPHPAHGEAGGLADQIPETELDSPGAGMAEPGAPVISQDVGDLLGLEGVLADEPRRDHIADEGGRTHAGSDAHHALIRLEAEDGGFRGRPACARRPGGMYRPREAQLVDLRRDARDPHQW